MASLGRSERSFEISTDLSDILVDCLHIIPHHTHNVNLTLIGVSHGSLQVADLSLHILQIPFEAAAGFSLLVELVGEASDGCSVLETQLPKIVTGDAFRLSPDLIYGDYGAIDVKLINPFCDGFDDVDQILVANKCIGVCPLGTDEVSKARIEGAV